MDTINVEKRDMSVKVNHLRKAGFVPCAVYGGPLPESLSIQMTQQDANQLFVNNRDGSKVALKLDGKLIPALIKEELRDFNTRDIKSIGFQALKADQPINSIAHVLVKNADKVPGIVEHIIFEVPYHALPQYMIDTVTIDLEGKGIGTCITIADIPEFCDEHVDVKLEPDTLVLRIADLHHVEETEEAPAEE